jgi:hypothetical protein
LLIRTIFHKTSSFPTQYCFGLLLWRDGGANDFGRMV